MLGTTGEPLTNQQLECFMAKPILTAQRLREILNYDPETGVFTKNGKEVGFLVPPKNYRRVMVDGTQYYAHRLAFLYMTGEWPHQADHINGIKTDNRWANLRDVDNRTNMENMRRPMKNSKSGVLGVCWAKNEQKWKAQISINNVNTHVGYADTIEEAEALYLAAKRRLHEGCTI